MLSNKIITTDKISFWKTVKLWVVQDEIGRQLEKDGDIALFNVFDRASALKRDNGDRNG